MKSYGVTISMKPLQQYFHMVPFYWVYSSSKLKSVDEILWCYHLNETSLAELSPHGSQYFLCSSFNKKNFWNFVKCFITLATFESERFQRELWSFIVTTIWPKLWSKWKWMPANKNRLFLLWNFPREIFFCNCWKHFAPAIDAYKKRRFLTMACWKKAKVADPFRRKIKELKLSIHFSIVLVEVKFLSQLRFSLTKWW